MSAWRELASEVKMRKWVGTSAVSSYRWRVLFAACFVSLLGVPHADAWELRRVTVEPPPLVVISAAGLIGSLVSHCLRAPSMDVLDSSFPAWFTLFMMRAVLSNENRRPGQGQYASLRNRSRNSGKVLFEWLCTNLPGRTNLIGQENLRWQIRVVCVRVLDIGIRLLQFRLRIFDDRPESELVPRLSQLQTEVRLLAKLPRDRQPLERFTS